MNTNTKHTPTPYKFAQATAPNGALCYRFHGPRGEAVGSAYSLLDVAFICKAANVHDDLIALARDVVAKYGSCTRTAEQDAIYERAKALTL